MQGLPVHQLSKSAQGSSKTHGAADGKASAKTKAEAGAHVEGSQEEAASGDFSSLFASMTGKAASNSGKPSEVKSDTGETLKNLLAEKSEKSEKTNDGKVSVDPKLLQIKSAESLAKSNSNLDQLLNNLKGTQDATETEEGENGKNNSLLNSLKGNSKNAAPTKGELKSESPLEFLMKGAKGKGVTENTTPETHIENNQASKKVMTAEDYLKSMQSTDKKSANLTLLNGKGELDQNSALSKMMNQNATKNYGQGMNLLNDPLIKNTKDLVNKDVKKGKSSVSGIDEILQSKDTKVGAELASIKQVEVAGVQNNKNNHGQQETQTNANQKVLDLSNIHTSNTTEIIKKISDYVEQNNVAGKQSLDLTVKHESLGEFKIQVSKMPDSMNRGLNQIDMQITTSSKEGHDFFLKNEVSLMKNLNQAGINLSDLRIISSMSESTPFGQSDSRQSSSFQQNPDGSKQFSSFESRNFAGSGGEGSERRKELWEEYQQRYGA